MLKRDNVEKKFVLYFYYCHAIPIAVPVRFLVKHVLARSSAVTRGHFKRSMDREREYA